MKINKKFFFHFQKLFLKSKKKKKFFEDKKKIFKNEKKISLIIAHFIFLQYIKLKYYCKNINKKYIKNLIVEKMC